jgi:hypothetical protein
MIKSSFRRIARLATIVGVLAAGISANAATTGITGRPQFNNDAGCFTFSQTGQVTQQNCPGTRRTWCVSEYIESSGSKLVQVNGFQPAQPDSSLLMSCTARGVTREGNTNGNASSTGLWNVVNTDGNLPTMTVSVPSFGSLVVCCNMGPGSTINTINF